MQDFVRGICFVCTTGRKVYGIARSQLIPISQKADSQVYKILKLLLISHKVGTRALGQTLKVLLHGGKRVGFQLLKGCCSGGSFPC